jgi:3',5'-cyclic AMP phosphodiesterase CpdA
MDLNKNPVIIKKVYMEKKDIIFVKKLKLRCGTVIILFLLVISGMTVKGIAKKELLNSNEERGVGTFSNDFYFIHITDTHVMNKVFDWHEVSKKRLRSLLDYVCTFEKKPAFIVITGDLTEWGGSRISGALNCRAFASCFYEKNASFYADANYSIPIFTTPGNHDYCYNRNLMNYHRIIYPVDRYIVQYQDVSLFFMNSGPSYYEEVYNWVENIDGDGLYDDDMEWLESHLEKCNSSIKIVLMHHPAVNVRNTNGMMWDVLARNRETFVTLCEQYGVDVVLAGHTHEERIFDGNETFYSTNTSLNCSLYPTLFVQTDDCKQGVHYRNVSISGDNIWLERCAELSVSVTDDDFPMTFQQFYIDKHGGNTFICNPFLSVKFKAAG